MFFSVQQMKSKILDRVDSVTSGTEGTTGLSGDDDVVTRLKWVIYLYSKISSLWRFTFIYEPAHGIMALFVLRKLPYFMCANSEGSGKTAQMRRLAWAFAGRQFD